MDVVTIGETMLLFTPDSIGLMRHANTFSAKVAGAESNVAIGLSRLGHKAGWISRVGDDEFGEKIRSFIRGEGVDISLVKKDSTAPTGIFFKEFRNPSDVRVYYYRKHSAASLMCKEDINEEYISKAKYLHITGITPALSDSCHEMVLKAVHLAKKHGVTVVFDPNLRRKLWEEERARRVLLEFVRHADIVLPGISEAEFLFGSRDPVECSELFLKQGASLVVMKLGNKGAYYVSEKVNGRVDGFKVPQVVDPVGAGDGFAAGFLSGMLDGLHVSQAVERGCAVGAMVVMVPGDVEGLPDQAALQSFITAAKDGDDVQR
ncbi:sugar kinase [Fodinisporobacter ferrooxydans]|uniref:Sugar kinase n=1 Tax=Fodinisporobacter ferrooxydans TaxID=2901836 RepID=A0ABY4CQ06_9BACL|nr:sugar kinase [Alicyclobacillaceae bacterium MYW30-H2]